MTDVKPKIPLSKPFINEKMKEDVMRVIESGNYILGENCRELEKRFAEYIGAKHAILTSSGTSAIQLSLLALGIGKGDKVLVPSHTAFPTIEPVFHVNAEPVFVDIDESYTIDINDLKKKIGKGVKAVIPVHLYGQPANIEEIRESCAEKGLALVEDCCQAHGAEFNGKKVGSFGDCGAFSFYPSKNMSVGGDGGIVTTNNTEAAEKIRMLRNHGRKDRYLHEIVGYNLRFNEIQAAIGIEQLKNLPNLIAKRRENANYYTKLLGGTNIMLPSEIAGRKHSFHLFVIRSKNRDELMENLKKDGIESLIHYPVPNHLQPAVTKIMKTSPLPVTERIAKEILSIPMHPFLEKSEIEYVAERIKANC